MDEGQSEVQLAVRRRLELSHDTGLSWLLIMLVLFLLALAIFVFGSTEQSAGPLVSGSVTPTESRAARIYTVSYRNGVFSPTNLRIKAGDTVRFHNDGLLSIHVASDRQPENAYIAGFDSVGDMPGGSYFSFTFAVRGTFGYHNDKNPNETGVIIVR